MMKKLLKNIAALVFGCLVGLALLELALRIHNPIEQRVKGNRIVLPVNHKYRLTNRDIPGIPERIVHTKNSVGFRGEEMPSSGADSVLSVIAVGGSTTECLYLPDGSDWPARLGDSMKPHFRRFWINNAGLDGHSTYGHAVLMSDYIVRLRPKVVLFLVGANEIGNTGGTDFEAPQVKGRLLTTSFDAFMKSASAHSEVASLLLNLYRYSRARSQGLPHTKVNLKTARDAPYPDADLDAVLEEHSRSYIPLYAGRLRKLIGLCRTNGIVPVLITQPALFGPGVDPVTHRDMARVLAEDRSGYGRWRILELYNDTTRRIAVEDSVFLVDLAAEMPRNSAYFYDYLHYTVAGSDEVARILASRLLPFLSGTFPEFLSAAPRRGRS
jgi:hypothetical protein